MGAQENGLPHGFAIRNDIKGIKSTHYDNCRKYIVHFFDTFVKWSLQKTKIGREVKGWIDFLLPLVNVK